METTPEQSAEGLAIVHVLATVLDRLVVANAALARTDPGQVTKFHAMKAPGIGILQYLERIHKYASCSNECFILALIYIDRLIQSNNFLLTELNVHRVVITAVLLAAKFFDDAYYNNAYYAKVGGVLVSEMNGLEVDFLFRVNFSLHVTPEIFAKYRGELLAQSHAVSPPPPSTITAYAQTSYVSVVNPQQPPVCDSNSMENNHYSSVDAMAPHVTPPLPIEANLAQECGGLQYTDAQILLNRSKSFPEQGQRLVDPNVGWVPQRCAHSSFPAPVSAPVYASIPYNHSHLIQEQDRLIAAAMVNRILPLQEGVTHHHHGLYVQQNAAPDPRLQPC